jgi:transposase
LCLLIPGGLPRSLSAERAGRALRTLRPADVVDVERKRMASELLADVRRLDSQLATIKNRIAIAVDTSGTKVTDVHGVGPIVAALIVGHTGDVRRFPTAGHFARYNGTPRSKHPADPGSGTG